MMNFESSAMVSSVAFEKTSCSFKSKDEGCCVLSPRKEKRKRLCNEVKYELVEFDSLPNYLKDNEFILGYYRSEWPLKQTILSIFSIHNETLNVWTHLIGFFIFLALTICTAIMVPTDMLTGSNHQQMQPGINDTLPCIQTRFGYVVILPSAETIPSMSNWNLPHLLTNSLPEKLSRSNHTDPACVLLSSLKDDVTKMIASPKPITRWPFFAFLCGAMFCLLTSSACHLLSCHCEHYAYVMLRLDYTGISALIVTSFYPLVYYSFMCDPFFRNLYIGFITAFGIATISVSLVPVFQTPEFRTVRALLFFCMAVSGLVPIMHKLVAFSHRPEALLTTGYELLMGVFYGMGVVVYATRVPERWMPGKFDLAGHSHQLFHVLVIAGAYTHYLAGLVYLKWRDMEGC